MQPNNALERGGRTARAVALCALAGAQWRRWSAVQLNRWHVSLDSKLSRAQVFDVSA